GVIDVGPGIPSTDSHGSRLGVDVRETNCRQIHYKTPVDDAETCSIVTSAPYGEQDSVIPGKIHARNDVRYVRAAHDPARPAIDHCVVDMARLFILGMSRFDQLTS